MQLGTWRGAYVRNSLQSTRTLRILEQWEDVLLDEFPQEEDVKQADVVVVCTRKGRRMGEDLSLSSAV